MFTGHGTIDIANEVMIATKSTWSRPVTPSSRTNGGIHHRRADNGGDKCVDRNGATVLPGVTIGADFVVAAGGIVTR